MKRDNVRIFAHIKACTRRRTQMSRRRSLVRVSRPSLTLLVVLKILICFVLLLGAYASSSAAALTDNRMADMPESSNFTSILCEGRISELITSGDICMHSLDRQQGLDQRCVEM